MNAPCPSRPHGPTCQRDNCPFRPLSPAAQSTRADRQPVVPEEWQMIGESSPANSSYNTSVAMEFFRFAGKPKTFAKGKKIFSENQRGIPFLLMPNRMYLLLDD